MFEGEKNGSGEERGSLLSFRRNASAVAREHAAQAYHVDDAQSRHRVARSRREARHNAILDALADDDRRTAAAGIGEQPKSAAQPASPPATEDRGSPAEPSRAPKEAGPFDRLKDFAREWGARSDHRAIDASARESAVAPQADNAGAFEQPGRSAGRREDDRRLISPADGGTWTPLIDPLKVIGRVFDSKALILSTTLIGALLGVAIALSTPKKYEAITELLVDPRDLKLSERDLTEQGLPSDATLAIVENQARVLTSGTVLSKVVERLNLEADPEFNGERKSFGIRAFIGELRSILSRDGDEANAADYRKMFAIENLARALTVERGGKTFVITIGASTESPEKSALIANTMTDVFLTTYGQIQSQTAGRAADELTARLDELRKGVEEAERKVAAFKAENDIIDPQGRLITDDEIVKLNEQLSVARAHTMELNARAASVRDVDVDSVVNGATPESMSSNIVTELRSQYAALKNESDRMAVRLGPRHPERQAAEAQLAGAREQIAAELRRMASSVQLELKRAVELEQQLAQRLAQLKVRQGDLSGELVQLRELEREASTKRAVYESYLLRARETGEQRDINTANMSVISVAYPPLDPSGPSRSVIALTGAFLGFASGVGFAMMRGAYDSLRDRRRDAARRRREPLAPHPEDAGPGPSGGSPRPGSSGEAADARSVVGSGQASRLEPAASDQARATRARDRDTSPDEDSSMLTRPADPYYPYAQEPTYAGHQPGWAPAPSHAYADPGHAYAAYPQPQTYAPQGGAYAQPQQQPVYAQPAGGYPQMLPYPPAPAPAQPLVHAAPYPYPPQPDPHLQSGNWFGQAPSPYPVYAPAQGRAPAPQHYAQPAYPPAHAYAPPPVQARPVAQPISFPGRHVQAADAPQPSSQTLTERDTSSAIADIRASLAEFREAVRDFTESRQKRRFY
jgi:uncharacterized protein involved in exopolysaccharide biosynthesis